MAFPDGLNGVGSLENLKNWWDLLEQESRTSGYHVKPIKSHLIGKENIKTKQNRYFKKVRTQ